MPVSLPLEIGIAATFAKSLCYLEERSLDAIVGFDRATEQASGPAPKPSDLDAEGFRSSAIDVYRSFMGCDPAETSIDNDDEFDRHVLACILTMAVIEEGAVAQRAGLASDDLTALIARYFPAALNEPLSLGQTAQASEDDEVVMVRDLLRANRSTDGKLSGWLAAMVARRAVEPNHLWEDLGLRDRSELTRLLNRHFSPLASRNTNHMRWKRFFYRALCENDGLVMCSTPVCSRCGDFDLCFGDESGESRMAYQRRTLALKVASLWELENTTNRAMS